ncbi:COX15/CtaA family protein [Pedobacter sp. P351]|uniref:COX15/CtaA family protein n=1 Tax=Pedobacter superstes TaxID=3133441 RepID=UPI0030AE72AF
MHHKTKAIGIWLLIGVGMIIVQVVLGGITRLTGSGLSITEWKPLMGVLPPLNELEWQQAFHKYQQIAQFKQLNAHFSSADFKFIFFWEWFHRLWGRLLGLVFFIPFLVFLIKGVFTKSMIKPLLVLFILGALQGFIGWIMVKSGLNDRDLYVSHIRLAIHFVAAMVLLVFTFWFALEVLFSRRMRVSDSYLKNFSLIILALVFVQLVYGAFMAGLKAGVFAPTWPDINGMYLINAPEVPLWRASVSDPLTIHFIHRTLAYIIALLLVVWTLKVRKKRGSNFFHQVKWLPLLLVVLQMVLGVYATLTSYKAIPQGWGVFEWNAQMHQLVAIFLVLSLTLMVFVLKGREH